MEAKALEQDPRFVEQVDLSEVYFMRFQPGDDLFAAVSEACKEQGIDRAVIVSGIGSLVDVSFVSPKEAIEIPVVKDKLNFVDQKGPFELLTLEGNVVPLVGEFGNMKEGDPVLHLHVTLATKEGEISGGHLVKATVFTTTELFLANVKNSKVKKKQSCVTGLCEMRDDI